MDDVELTEPHHPPVSMNTCATESQDLELNAPLLNLDTLLLCFQTYTDALSFAQTEYDITKFAHMACAMADLYIYVSPDISSQRLGHALMSSVYYEIQSYKDCLSHTDSAISIAKLSGLWPSTVISDTSDPLGQWALQQLEFKYRSLLAQQNWVAALETMFETEALFPALCTDVDFQSLKSNSMNSLLSLPVKEDLPPIHMAETDAIPLASIPALSELDAMPLDGNSFLTNIPQAVIATNPNTVADILFQMSHEPIQNTGYSMPAANGTAMATNDPIPIDNVLTQFADNLFQMSHEPLQNPGYPAHILDFANTTTVPGKVADDSFVMSTSSDDQMQCDLEQDPVESLELVFNNLKIA
ncbi:uncharacterized protein BJ171DRAFT_572014 [Polychytrium aggregatum]|uniref:uncharacterized protein n=1 Tax=Polychytrium aggregatum TaxID=110093 RepID=UPI0022FE6568|nr:uncharacterized protein BJ171DRAFT_572014 [Polychytrium aggregatum]KAI9193404.1 hypothetical protein BJ171DRAFT_572014 [Polychytrium aggregatum]